MNQSCSVQQNKSKNLAIVCKLQHNKIQKNNNYGLVDPPIKIFDSLLRPASSSKHQKNCSQFNIQLHDPQLCVCQSCECGKHKCEIHCNRPQLKNTTTYKNSYYKSKKSCKLKTQECHYFTPKTLIEKFVDATTIYQQKYSSKKGEVEKPIMQMGVTKFQGPIFDVTTYQQKHPGYFGSNPYIKTKPDQFRGGLKFKGSSTYNSQFMNRTVQLNKPIKRRDHLRTSSEWFGSSSYKQAFKAKNPQQITNLDYKPAADRYQIRPSSAYAYESSYRRGYVNPSSIQSKGKCPAQRELLALTKNLINLQQNKQFTNRNKQAQSVYVK